MNYKRFITLVGILGTGTLFSLSTESQAAEVDTYRLYNPNSGEHFYTVSEQERNYLIDAGWNDEGFGWTAPEKGDKVYRLYNPNVGDHFYTLNIVEYNQLKNFGWIQEGAAFYSGTQQDVPIYRLYNSNQFAFNHHYTESKKESDWLNQLGWNFEGIAWYGTKKTPPIENHKVTINYLDTDGNILQAAKVESVKSGESYTATAPEITDYTLQGNPTQTLNKVTSDQTINFTYQKNPETPISPTEVTVTINYLDTDGNILQAAKVESVKSGESYTATAPEITDYTLQGSPTQTIDRVTSDQTITFSYQKNPETPAPQTDVTVTVNYLVADDSTILDSYSETVAKGTSFTAEAKKFENYTVTNGTKQTVDVNGDLTLEFIYRNNDDIFSYYIDMDNNVTIGDFKSGISIPDLVIPEKINGLPVIEIDNYSFANKQLSAVSIPETVVRIGGSAFKNNQLSVVTIPDNVEVLGESAFYNNPNLTSASLPAFFKDRDLTMVFDNPEIITIRD